METIANIPKNIFILVSYDSKAQSENPFCLRSNWFKSKEISRLDKSRCSSFKSQVEFSNIYAIHNFNLFLNIFRWIRKSYLGFAWEKVNLVTL